jgi:hypothetical protein
MSRIKAPRSICPHCGNLYVPPVTLVCANESCAREFERTPSDVSKHRKKLGNDAPSYCSRDCAVAGRVGRKYKTAVVPTTDKQSDWNAYLSAIGLGEFAGTHGGKELQSELLENL